jgi:hypothetical protein
MQTHFMSNTRPRSIFLLLFVYCLSSISCNKTDFLNAKPSSNLVVPSTLEDFQQLLDNQRIMTESGALGTLSSDEYFLQDNFWATLSAKEQNAYIWAPDIFAGQGSVSDWNALYIQSFYANVVLEGLSKIQVNPANQANWNYIAGWAYFVRANAFYNLVQVFAPMYDSTSADKDLGIPLKLKADINEIEQRSSVQDSYQQIIQDLNQAKNLLPPVLPVNNRNRPSKQAALALLARIYLAVGDYALAGNDADSSLQIYPTLIDYNTGTVFSTNNDETLYQNNQAESSSALFYLQFGNYALIDTNLYALYDSNDLRKTLFFAPNGLGYFNLLNTYDGYGYCFSGLATDECYLIRAESFARAGNINSAMQDLNELLVRRYRTGTFVPHVAAGVQDAIAQILLERRKELFLRGVRFTDLRRLNKEGYNITLTRKLNGQIYSLPPNSPLYVLPIPPDEISLSGIAQNQR